MTQKRVIPYQQYKKDDAILTVRDVVSRFDLTPYDDPDGEYKGQTPQEWLDEEGSCESDALYRFANHHSDFDYRDDGSIWKACPKCDSYGEIEDEDPCPKCHGQRSSVCSYCEGHGTVEVMNPCEDCESEGWIEIGSYCDFIDKYPEHLAEVEKYASDRANSHYQIWLNALERTLEHFLLNIDLDLEAVRVRPEPNQWIGEGEHRRFFRPETDGFRIFPRSTLGSSPKIKQENAKKGRWVRVWKPACEKILELIEGVGYFGWDGDVKRFVEESSCASYREAVLSHLGWLKWWGDVYGERNMSRFFDENFSLDIQRW